LGREAVVVNAGGTFDVMGGVGVVVTIVELFVRVEGEPKRLGPFTAANGVDTDA
jgi:hypothetical protein